MIRHVAPVSVRQMSHNMSHKTGQSDETCHFGGGAALFSIALVAASQRSTNGPQLARRSLPELEAAACGGKGLL